MPPARVMSFDEVAHLQLTSPDFALFCMDNVATREYEYLFSKGHPDRPVYAAALDRARTSLDTHGARTDGENGGSAASPATAHADGTSAGSPNSQLQQQQDSLPVPTPGAYVGPHKPYTLDNAGRDAFEAHLEALGSKNVNAENQSPSQALVQFMMRRKTKTEHMVHRLVVVMDSMPNAKRFDAFYVLSALWYEHEVESEKAKLEVDPYMPVFARYLVEAVKRVLSACGANKDSLQFVNQTVDVWSKSALVPASISAMRRLIDEHTAGKGSAAGNASQTAAGAL